MEKEYKVASDRYGHYHKFVQVSDNKYDFVPEETWMPVYVTTDSEDSKKVIFIDTEGGPVIGRGWSNSKVKVEDIVKENNRILFVLKEKAAE